MSMILHHYEYSPYSEKIRAMFGFTEMDWSSCITSEMPPRGKLEWLTGGYNRIPVAQIGSDIYCDTNIIADEIAKLSKKSKLANKTLKADDQAFRTWIEAKLFFACVNRAFTPKLIYRIAKTRGVVNLGLFMKDRIQMSAKASISLGSPRSAPKHIQKGITDIAARLGDQPFMGGEQPNILDFSAYHCFWFLIELGGKEELSENFALSSWYRKMRALVSEPADELDIESALEIAKNTKPKRITKDCLGDDRIGSEVTITPNDYRQIPVTGVLVGVNASKWIIKLERPETGPIHLHFPTHCVDVTIRLSQLEVA